ncbi:MAG: hypothetical protein EZS28_027216 [Streblomastix strix]|uniref:DUF4371 domain-containing protein n=1 Tax=Streblomastix strix TaxID=222440 RepID=A0A5J4V3E0_9EUKA|nr:MAG: hypothetical protein EZS28_027216 [Streblomastix strix]
MIDESTDIANLNQLITYIRLYYKGQILTNFQNIRQLGSQEQTAENLEKVFKQICEDYGLKLDNLVVICTDDAASIVRNRLGMVTRLKQQYPGLQSFHCSSHRWHLAAEDTIKYKELNQLKKAENVLLQIWHMFSTSPKNAALLAEMHTLEQSEQMSIKNCVLFSGCPVSNP